ncbi:AfsR/SARP family transcriptional regulator [Streptacidiphilus sp. P02-A3a]|nr:AfsR/SARP family transcriptional regulator [Streptacidiphilus sp. P02-A3a]
MGAATGPVEVRHAGSALALGGRRQRAVLSALALRANEVVSIDHLSASVWIDSPASPASNLRTYVAGLRRLLPPGEERRPRLVTHPGAYQLILERCELDLTLFEEEVALGTRARERSEVAAAARHFSLALGLWRGYPLEDVTGGPALQSAVAHLEERRLAVAEQHLQVLAALGEHERVIDELRPLVVRHPLRERLQARLMNSLHRAGRQAEALDVYAAVRRLLVSELGVEPGPDLRQVHRMILANAQDTWDTPAVPHHPSATRWREPRGRRSSRDRRRSRTGPAASRSSRPTNCPRPSSTSSAGRRKSGSCGRPSRAHAAGRPCRSWYSAVSPARERPPWPFTWPTSSGPATRTGSCTWNWAAVPPSRSTRARPWVNSCCPSGYRRPRSRRRRTPAASCSARCWPTAGCCWSRTTRPTRPSCGHCCPAARAAR